jgi:hypothetical protein
MDFEGTPGTPREQEASSTSGDSSRIQSGMGSTPENTYDPSRSKVAEVIPIRPAEEAQPESPDDPPIPVWMQRANIVMKFLICVWLGMVVSVLPWTPAWSDNSLILSLPNLRAIVTLDFVKGVITGIGIIDIWIGIWEAVHYRDQRPAPRTPVAR